MVLNFGFAHGVVVVMQSLGRVDDADDLELSVGVYSLVSKYYAMYPISVGS